MAQNQNPWLNLAGALVSGLADVGANEVKRHAGDYLGLPKLPQPPQTQGQLPDFASLVLDASDHTGLMPEWDGDTPILSLDHAGRRWAVELYEEELFVHLAVRTELVSSPGLTQMLLARNSSLYFGGWMVRQNGSVACRGAMMKEGCDGVKLHGLAKFMVIEVARVMAQLGR